MELRRLVRRRFLSKENERETEERELESILSMRTFPI